MNAIKKLSFLIIFLTLTSACSVYRVTSKDITTDYYPSKKSANEIIYVENIEKPHTVIAYITINAERRQYMSEVLDKMKRESAILGGDAITAIKTDASGTWKSLPVQNVIGNAYVRANFSAAVIVFQ